MLSSVDWASPGRLSMGPPLMWAPSGRFRFDSNHQIRLLFLHLGVEPAPFRQFLFDIFACRRVRHGMVERFACHGRNHDHDCVRSQH
jgi:hypothetical protein